ncbi:hypothetical protein [Mycobacteroides immunogenum]|uniref:Uncharacterized protein n=1 Tax=Mycobacteroides immunogenum TaxID=83262 RepID=A0A7V8LJR1_9MYCO|nr:hypothetical protein [Mycobacteroides immunogenum]AMT71957.1 hypothetical protein ABG82_18320 [Mycobacteroides immunogenum]ANO05089.1 hypothetical protein BAB75_18605 [Mycobacteroides immunogenum]KIU40237.1 hypothetical protein TL11_13360 [Mycobacteroides immunogenum]KPG02853.1 hypothetical protein AN909_26470 [Mycobacteroides immunogenum]KPG02940.1 hypothetical protein AN908_26920 [Mycobacteroides immunogenum]
MAKHEMRHPTAERPVVRILPERALRGNGILYRTEYSALHPLGDITFPGGRLGRVPTKPTSHAKGRRATVDRPIVVQPNGTGRFLRIGMKMAEQMTVQAIL